ncbi:MAG: hypothetical protein ACOY90_17600 [Candidatus Zhuqueibacterota bacterium]
MDTYSIKYYRKYLKRSRELLQLEPEFHFIAVLYLFIYYTGMIKYLAARQRVNDIEIKLSVSSLSDWLNSFDLKLSSKLINLLVYQFVSSLKIYSHFLKKKVPQGKMKHHKEMLDLLFDPEEIVLNLSIFGNIAVDYNDLIDFHTTLDVIEFPTIN